MAFTQAQIIKTELTRDGQNRIIKIYLSVQIQDDAIVGMRQFDYVVDGGTLEEVRGNIKAGVMELLKTQTRQEHTKWLEENAKSIEVKSELTPLQIKSQFGTDTITTL